MRLACLLVLFGSLNAVHSYKILVYCSGFSQSVNNFLGNIADTLVEAGHDVTTVIPIIIPDLRDGTQKSKTIYVQPTEKVEKMTDIMFSCEDDFIGENNLNFMSAVSFGEFFMEYLNSMCSVVLDEPGLMEKLINERFDVMIVENFEACGVALSHLIKPKSLITTAASIPMAQQGEDFGLDSALSYNPSALISDLDVHSFWSRLWNIYADFVYAYSFRTGRIGIDALFRDRYGLAYPTIYEISSNAAFTFINTEPLFDFAAPTLSRIVPIGGIGAKEPKKLDGDLDRIMKLRNKTVLISFGSIVLSNTLPLPIKQNIVQTIAGLPEVTFLWKYEQPEDEFAKHAASTTPNLHLFKWTPQNDLLVDDRLTAFITHGGMASTQETALRGKPGIYIPFFGDQFRNSGMMEKNGLGIVFNKHDLYDADKFHDAIAALLNIKSYAENSAKIAQMIKKKPFSAKELLVKTVEFAAEFGPSPALRPQSFDLTWIEYYNMDIISVIAFMFLIVAYSSLTVAILVLRKLLSVMKNKH